MMTTRPEVDRLLERASVGDAAAWGALLTEHEPRLCGMVAFRLHPSLRGRVDAADVIQDAFIVATARRCEPAQRRIRRGAWDRKRRQSLAYAR